MLILSFFQPSTTELGKTSLKAKYLSTSFSLKLKWAKTWAKSEMGKNNSAKSKILEKYQTPIPV